MMKQETKIFVYLCGLFIDYNFMFNIQGNSKQTAKLLPKAISKIEENVKGKKLGAVFMVVM